MAFIGREQERSTLLRRLDSTLAGSGGLVLIEGAAGAGKTRLLEEVTEDAHWRGFNVLWGRRLRTAAALCLPDRGTPHRPCRVRARALGAALGACLAATTHSTCARYAGG